MIGVSWPGNEVNEAGGVEVWTAGVIVTVGNESSPVLTDFQSILRIYHALGDWLIAHRPETVSTPE